MFDRFWRSSPGEWRILIDEDESLELTTKENHAWKITAVKLVPTSTLVHTHYLPYASSTLANDNSKRVSCIVRSFFHESVLHRLPQSRMLSGT